MKAMKSMKLPKHSSGSRMGISCVLAVLLAASAGRTANATGETQSLPGRTAGDRTAVDLTVYNANLALVREERTINLGNGGNRVWIPEVPATIDPTSVHFVSKSDPQGVRVLEQNYQYDLVDQRRLLERFIGKAVQFVRFDAEHKREVTVTGKLLSVGADPSFGAGGPEGGVTAGIVAEVEGKIEINPAGRLVLPGLPEGLVLRPRLEWILDSDRGGDHKTEISYLAQSLSWSCDYVALLDKDDAKLDLTGWVTLVNNSGTTFRNAGLKLVAGDVNRVADEAERGVRSATMALKSAPPQFRQDEVFEYKLYSLERRTDIADNESKQIELVSGRGAATRKLLVFDGLERGWRNYVNQAGYRGQGSFGQQSESKVGVFLTFRNDAKSGLGVPLPKGRVRVYKKDKEGKEQFIGEDRLDHTPKDEEIRLRLGNAFDVVGGRVQVDFRNLPADKGAEETLEIKIRNHKQEPVEVIVYEHPWRWSRWEILKSSSDWKKVDQSTLRFPLKIEADGEKTLIYTIRYTW